jgi:hypothetical protein
MSNTGIVRIYNNTSFPVLVVDPEPLAGGPWEIPAGHNIKLGRVAPWCSNAGDVRTKAIKIHAQFSAIGGLPPGITQADIDGAYLFQNTEAGSPFLNRICWQLATKPLHWNQVLDCGEGPSSWVNVAIGDDGETYSVVANAVQGQNG